MSKWKTEGCLVYKKILLTILCFNCVGCGESDEKYKLDYIHWNAEQNKEADVFHDETSYIADSPEENN